MKILVGYDGTLQSKEALKFGLEKIRKEGGELVALHTYDTDLLSIYGLYSLPMVERRARAESRIYVEEAKQILKEAGDGIRTSLLVGDGNPEEELIDFARSLRIDMVLCPPSFKSVIKSLGRKVEDAGTADIAADLTQFEMVSTK